MARGEVDKGICLTNAEGKPLRESLVKPTTIEHPCSIINHEVAHTALLLFFFAVIVPEQLSFVSNGKCLRSSC